MKTLHLERKFIFLIALFGASLGASKASFAACDQTLNPGANVASAVSNAAAGSTICLNSGDYGSVTISGVSKSGAVTLQSSSGTDAKIGITLSNSNQLTFKSLTLSSLQWSGNSNSNIKVLNNIFKGQMYIFGNGGKQNNLIDGNTFDGISVGNDREGRLSIYGGGDLIVSNNHFGGRGESDGIQVGGTGTVIGPGNVFEDLTQEGYTRHVDSIQQYGEVKDQTITGNYFINNTVCIGDYESSENTTVTNNVFIASDSNNKRCVLDFGSSKNINFSHNTVKSNQMRVGAINQSAGSTGVISNNIFLNNSFNTPGAGFSGTISHNLFTSGNIEKGSNTQIGTPTFAGGSNPTNMAGYPLTSSSLGYKSASDGKDRGINLNGAVTTATNSIAAPSNLRIQ